MTSVMAALNVLRLLQPSTENALQTTLRFYSARNPLERRTMKELVEGVSGGRGGRGGRGRRKGGVKGMNLKPFVRLGVGSNGIRWPGVSTSLPSVSSSIRSHDWLQADKLQMQKVDEEADDTSTGVVDMRDFDEVQRRFRRDSELNWSRRGWSGIGWRGRYVGCPESPDGTPLPEFSSIVIELKRVVNQTRGGKKRSVSALVVVGNKEGAAGFAVGKADTPLDAIRKAKNKAVNYLSFVPRCDGHTIYHNIQTKYKRTNLYMEKKVKGHGLSCQRAVAAICNLLGIQDMRAKIVGSTNPLNIVRATFKGLSSQETHQELADKTNKFLVEYRRECGMRPVVVAVPASKKESSLPLLESLQMVPKQYQLTRDH